MPDRLTYATRDMSLSPQTTPYCWSGDLLDLGERQGFRPDAIKRQLAHDESNKVCATYNKAKLVDERFKNGF